jgi:hypothetical protein
MVGIKKQESREILVKVDSRKNSRVVRGEYRFLLSLNPSERLLYASPREQSV